MRRFVRGTPSRVIPVVLPAILLFAPACRRDGGGAGPGPQASASAKPPSGLTPELAARVLARVGDHTITLGDYAAVLEKMDRFERLRYQTADRRKQLLDELIDIELLAREAERRGLSERPETQELVRQILRDEVRKQLRDQQPLPEQIPPSEVRAYYEAHRDDFREPERRRVAHVALSDRAAAQRTLTEAKAATPKQWGELVQKYSIDRKAGEIPVELAGDLGMVVPPAFGKNDNPRVPEVIRAAAFELDSVPGVVARLVEESGVFHIVRVTGKNAPRDRTLEEAERPIRVRLAQENLRKAEADLERELRGRFPVRVDEAALAKVVIPAGSSAAPGPAIPGTTSSVPPVPAPGPVPGPRP